MLATTLTCASPPRRRPTSRLANSNSRSVILLAFMMSADRMNSGTDISTKLENRPFRLWLAAIAMS